MKPRIIALVGNPSCGKTTLFNGLTGGQQCVGNWSGVTVEKKRGYFQEQNTLIEVIDLPGCYQWISDTREKLSTQDKAMDEHITYEYLLSGKIDIVINVVDATHLKRHLYLTLQLLEYGFSVIVALN